MSADVRAMCEQLVAERTGYMLATPEDRAKLSAYLDGLDRTHADDPAMCVYVARTRARLTDAEAKAATP